MHRHADNASRVAVKNARLSLCGKVEEAIDGFVPGRRFLFESSDVIPEKRLKLSFSARSEACFWSLSEVTAQTRMTADTEWLASKRVRVVTDYFVSGSATINPTANAQSDYRDIPPTPSLNLHRWPEIESPGLRHRAVTR